MKHRVEYSATFAENVQRYRKKLGISQEDLARICPPNKDGERVHRNTIGQIERGEAENPGIDLIVRLAYALKIRPKDLLEGVVFNPDGNGPNES